MCTNHAKFQKTYDVMGHPYPCTVNMCLASVHVEEHV